MLFPVADEDRYLSSAVTQRHNLVLNVIAIQVADSDVIAGRKKVAARQPARQLPRLQQSSLLMPSKRESSEVFAAHRFILDSVAVQIHDRHGHGAS